MLECQIPANEGVKRYYFDIAELNADERAYLAGDFVQRIIQQHLDISMEISKTPENHWFSKNLNCLQIYEKLLKSPELLPILQKMLHEAGVSSLEQMVAMIRQNPQAPLYSMRLDTTVLITVPLAPLSAELILAVAFGQMDDDAFYLWLQRFEAQHSNLALVEYEAENKKASINLIHYLIGENQLSFVRCLARHRPELLQQYSNTQMQWQVTPTWTAASVPADAQDDAEENVSTAFI